MAKLPFENLARECDMLSAMCKSQKDTDMWWEEFANQLQALGKAAQKCQPLLPSHIRAASKGAKGR